MSTGKAYTEFESFMAMCTTRIENRLLYGRTPEEIDEWKVKMLEILRGLDAAQLALSRAIVANDNPDGIRKCVTEYVQIREAVLDCIIDL